MTEMNGFHHADNLDDIAAEIKQLVAAEQPSPRVQEIEPISETPFEQQSHSLLQKSVDQIASDWIHQLKLARENSLSLEQLVLQRVTATKAHITALYMLGNAAMAEARRASAVNEQLARELDKLVDQHS
jgi:hypothetical protein